MANNNLNDIKSVILLASRLQNLFEGFDETNKSAVLTSKVKILIQASIKDRVSPSLLKRTVGLAKSNIALLCGKLQKEGLIEKYRDAFDTREISYGITDAGRDYLNDFLTKAKKNFEGELAYKNNIEQINKQVKALFEMID